MNIKFSQSILRDLEGAVQHPPDLSTDRGDLYLASHGRAVIKLKVDLEDYLGFVNSLPEDDRPKASELFPLENASFNMVLNLPVSIRDGKVFTSDGKEITVI